jgi:DNA-binding NtrC family response regulator
VELSGGNKSQAARRLGISRKTLERKLRRWERLGGAGAAPSQPAASRP